MTARAKKDQSIIKRKKKKHKILLLARASLTNFNF